MTEPQSYIGEVEKVTETDTIGHLRPLYLYDKRENTSDLHLLGADEVYERFPNRGLVMWFDPPKEAIEGTVWLFEVEEQWYDSDDPSQDAFKVIFIDKLKEVLDVRNEYGVEGARLRLTQDGVCLPFTPSDPIYLWVEEHLWVGPVHLRCLDGRWFLDSKDQNNPLRCTEAASVEKLIHRPHGRLFAKPGKMGKYLGMVDWASDEIILSRVLRWLQHIDSTYASDLGLTAKAIARAVRHLDIEDATHSDQMLDIQRLRRAQVIWRRIEERQELVEQLASSLLHVPSISEKIEKAIREARQKTISEIRAEASTHIEDLSSQTQKIKQEITRLNREIVDKRNTLDQIERSIAEQQTLFAKQVDTLDTLLVERLNELMKRPEQLLTDVAILRTALRLSPTTPISIPRIDELNPPFAFCFDKGTKGDVLQDLITLRKVLRKTFQDRRLPTKAAGLLHSAFLTGAMPVLVGSNAFDMLDSYASCVCGGRLLWLPISTAMLEPTDLFGKVDPTTRRLIPHPSGLLDLLLHAHTTNELYLVVLDGMNRAAVDTYLAPILATYKDAWLRRQSRVLPLHHPYALDAHDPYASTTHLVWPSNVLLAGVLTEGVTTVPLPLSFWSSALLLHIDGFYDDTLTPGRNGASADKEDLAAPSSIAKEIWQQWRDQIYASDHPTCMELLQDIHDAGVVLRSEARTLYAQFYAAMQLWGIDEESAIEAIIVHGFVPFTTASRQINLLLDALGSRQQNTENLRLPIKLTEQALI
jgi:hypothetical protein